MRSGQSRGKTERVRRRGRLGAALALLGALLGAGTGTRAEEAGAVEAAGGALTVALPLAAAGLAAGLRDGRGLAQLGGAEAVTLGATYALKYAVDERRPDGDRHSFPSGHTAVSFAAAEYLRVRYGWAYGGPAYSLAAFVGYSRVEARRHHVHDVLAGAALGIGSSWLFTEPYRGWRVALKADGGYAGVLLARRW